MLDNYTPFWLVYGREAMVPAKFIVLNLFIAQDTKGSDDDSIEKYLQELRELEEKYFLEDFHESMEKER